MTRREAVHKFALFLAGSPLLNAQPATEATGPDPSLEDVVNVFDLDAICKTKTTQAAYDYVSGGGWDEQTLRRNREMFKKVMLLPRHLRKVDELDLSMELFDLKLPMPICVAPTGSHGMVHPEGELATARAAGAVDALMAVSSTSSYSIDQISAAAAAPLWFQLYVQQREQETRERVDNALAAGCRAICWTVDGPYPGPRERDVRNRNAYRSQRESADNRSGRRRSRSRGSNRPPSPYGVNANPQSALDWNFLDKLKQWTSVPVLIKGVMTPEDALMAVERGADGIVVSNHGGRYMDAIPSTIEVLPEIVDVVGGRIIVVTDSGYRRGVDILKALAIGAKAVFIGRPVLWGLGAFGEAGAKKALEILRKEPAWSMGQAGRKDIASIDRSLVKIDPA